MNLNQCITSPGSLHFAPFMKRKLFILGRWVSSQEFVAFLFLLKFFSSMKKVFLSGIVTEASGSTPPTLC